MDNYPKVRRTEACVKSELNVDVVGLTQISQDVPGPEYAAEVEERPCRSPLAILRRLVVQVIYHGP